MVPSASPKKNSALKGFWAVPRRKVWVPVEAIRHFFKTSALSASGISPSNQ